MFELSKDIYTNFKIDSIKPKLSEKVRAALIGYSGSGKTSLLNNLCKKEHKVGFNRGSTTHDISYEDSVYQPQSCFKLYDTPAMDSQEETLQYAKVIRLVLTQLPFNLIIINERVNPRFERTVANCKKQLKIFKGYESMVVCIFSQLDQVEVSKKQDLLKRIAELFKNQCSSMKVIVYSNKTSNFEELSKVLFKIGQSQTQQIIKIDDKTFYKHFNISHSVRALLTEQIENYVSEIQDEADIFIDFIKQFKKQAENAVEVIDELKVFMKNHLRQLQLTQYKHYSQSFDSDSQIIDLYLTISKLIQQKLQQFETYSYQKFGNIFSDIATQKYVDIRDLIKVCPNCKTPWMRSVDCNKMVCGEKDFNGFLYEKDMQNNEICGYRFEITKGKITYVKKQTKIVQKNEFTVLLNNGNRVGCGMGFNWDEQPRFQLAEQQLKQLFGVSNYEEIGLEMNWLWEKHREFEKQIDQRIKYYQLQIKQQLKIDKQ